MKGLRHNESKNTALNPRPLDSQSSVKATEPPIPNNEDESKCQHHYTTQFNNLIQEKKGGFHFILGKYNGGTKTLGLKFNFVF